jgi:polyferredoxin
MGFVGMIFGRAVCGWVCPIGLLQRATAKVARRFQKTSLAKRISKKISQHGIIKYMRYTKYIVLITLVFGTTYLIGFMFTDICPIGFLTGTLPTLMLNPGKFVPNPFFPVALIIFILFVVLILTVERGWCKYFCPVGAILSLFNKMSILHVSVNKDKCIHCNACTEVCPMGIDVPNMYRNPECIQCGKCVDACPVNAIKFGRK